MKHAMLSKSSKDANKNHSKVAVALLRSSSGITQKAQQWHRLEAAILPLRRSSGTTERQQWYEKALLIFMP
ncbi:hypothetical protein SUGI_0259300 [Cryptomeria japonica]|nr:hypothetical protein SUGI_0259300 [Cryptomeria japonica]